MFTKILIANRGEIACRVAATAKKLGIRTVAVYSDADAHANHVRACDESVHLGGSAPKDSYLRWEKILEAAKATTRAAINTSPEPFSNVGASLVEDSMVPAGLWLAVAHPLVFLALFILVLVLSVWLIRKSWRFLKALFTRVARIFSGRPDPGVAPAFQLKKNPPGDTPNV